MFTFLVSRSLKNRVLVLAIAVALMAYGAFAVTQLPVDVLPDLNRSTVSIMTEAEGYAPQEVEQLITFPIETQMNGLPGVTRVRSVSGVGLSIVYVEFDWGAEIYRSRQQVNERLALAVPQLPPNIAPQLGAISSLMGQILMIAVTNPEISAMELREIADFTIRPRLLTIPGVAQVIPMGGEVRQFRVSPNSAALRSFNVSPEQIERSLTSFGVNVGGGFTDQSAREYLIRGIGRSTSLEDLRNLVVTSDSNGPIYLRQLAAVEFAPRVKRGDAGYMGRPAVIVSIEKQPNVDTIRLTREVEAALKQIAGGLPQGTKLDQVIFRQADFISTSIRNVQIVLLEAIAVVAIILFLFLQNWRTTAISLTAIPVSILITALVFYYAGLSINTMTLGGIAIAIGRVGGRCCGRRRKYLPAPTRECCERGTTQCFRCCRECKPGGSLRYRLCDRGHHHGFHSIVCVVRHRGAALRAARAGLHYLDSCKPVRVDHAHAGHGVLHVARHEGIA
jgi:HME family heavy-metal exporter